MASAAAFLLSETVDLAVFTPLQRKGLVLAAAASSAVGLVADSVVFLYLAFGSLEFMAGQILGKAWMVACCAAVDPPSPPARDQGRASSVVRRKLAETVKLSPWCAAYENT